ncbi:MAG: DUF3592 domain-containing protein [Chitinophagaceae bacterium]
MYKAITIIFIACFLLYLPFSRTPDVFDSIKTQGVVVNLLDSATRQPKALVRYTANDKKVYTFDPSYLFLHYETGEKVPVRYEESHPQKAAVGRVWGYWLSWKELLSCVVIYVLLFQLSLTMVKNPAPESEKEQDRYDNRLYKKRPKYDGNTF